MQLHYLRPTNYSSKLDLNAFLKKPQGKFVLHSQLVSFEATDCNSSVSMLFCKKGHIVSLSGTKSYRANLIAYFASFDATDYIPRFKVQYLIFPAKRNTLSLENKKAIMITWSH